MKKVTRVMLVLAGSSFCTNAFANVPLNPDGSPVAGQSVAQYLQLKKECPECVMVAQDIVKMRMRYCKQSTTVDSIILQDPIYSYLNSIRLLVSNNGGYTNLVYTSARQIVAANVNCNDSNDWIQRSQKVMENTFNTGN
ncbi:hypothetical protein OO184_22780 [Photorhabdus sp. APURE]|uniref:hypothetical protein n=1 Tax=Photorhabdus aballayi TaxID=2991723 RepID=UPI00223CF4A0|nr:hypothetical protein [Photorhabdus aballayi]MCW7550677.1 hypothetical protein [Photorhabdus aballayi]